MTAPASFFQFCPSCGHPDPSLLRGHELRCAACGFRYFHSVATAVGALLVWGGKALFIERAIEPGKGLLGLPGGFVDPGESAEQALAREVREEVGGEIGACALVGSFPNRYQFAAAWYHTCDFYFRAELLTPPERLMPDPREVTRAVWLARSEVDRALLAFASLQAFWDLDPMAELVDKPRLG